MARAHDAEHLAARFGSAELYARVLDVVTGEMRALIRHDQPQATAADIDRVTAGLLRDVENAVLTTGRAATVASAMHYGAFRHVVGVGREPSLRWLWGTVLALLWTLATAGLTPDEMAPAVRGIEQHVGGREFKLFGAILLSLHRLFGILPAALHAHLAR